MPDHRRAAREYAMRVLYQADVGGRPIREALAGALEQLATSISSGTTMMVRRAEAEAAREPSGPAVFVSQTRKRERARIRRALGRELARLAAHIDGPLSSMFADPPQADADEVTFALEAGTQQANRRLDRILGSCSLPTDEVERALAIAAAAMDGMRRVLLKRLPRADATAQMLVALVHGIMQNRESIDNELAALAPHWPLERQSAVDRNILRLAAYEIIHMPQTPRAVVMNEAIEIAKRYSTAESSQFVNGVLAAVAARVEEQHGGAL